MTTKNKSQNGPFNRNFSLLGDPSLRLKIPELGIQVKEMIDLVSTTPIDSLRPLSQVELSAEITDPLTNTSVSNFNGNFEIELWDAPQKKQTLGDENEPFNFSEEDRLLFKGEGTVTGGKLTSKIFIPEKSTQALEKLTLRIKAIDPSLGMYSGGITKFPSGGKVENQITDRQGPTMRVEIANESKGLFTISSKRIKARVYFEDQSGIYISSENESRALKFQINDESSIPFSEKYRAFDGDFKRGQADLDLENLKEGLNEIIVSAWDNVGNGNSLSFSIEVKGSEQLRILDHKVFPNPANEESRFFFRHNRPGENLLAKLEVYSLTGQILFSESRRLVRAEEIIEDWNWIFLQSKSKYPGKGTYIYNLSLYTESDFTSDLVSGKLVIQ
jgi:hypothetical protein